MRFVRCLLLMLLAINLPGYGGAFAAAPACAMQHGPAADVVEKDGAGHDHAAAMAASDGHAAHCCADGAHPSKDPSKKSSEKNGRSGDHTCPDGMQCQCNALYQAAQPLVTTATPVSPGIDHAISLHIPPQVVIPILRPPIALTLR